MTNISSCSSTRTRVCRRSFAIVIVAYSEDIVKQVCELDSLYRGAEWIEWGKEMEAYTRVVITLGKECREEDPRVVCAKVGTLIDENSKSGDVIIFTDSSFRRGDQTGWGFSARRNGCNIKEDCCSYPLTTSSKHENGG